MAQYIMLSGWEGGGCLEIQEEVQARQYIFIFVGAFVLISHSISNASFVFSIVSVLKLSKHINMCDSNVFWNRIGVFVC